MVNRIDVDGNEANTVTIARQFAHFAEQNLRQIADGIGRLIRREPDEHKRDAALEPLFAVLRAQHQVRGASR